MYESVVKHGYWTGDLATRSSRYLRH